MNIEKIQAFTLENAIEIFKNNVDAIIAVNIDEDCYHTVLKRGFFESLIEENGTYQELMNKLWFHFNDTGESITEDYQVFIPALGKVEGKYSKRLKVMFDDIQRPVQMNIYPLDETGSYLFVLDVLDTSESIDEFQTNSKVNTIQNAYLFSMYMDLVKDTTSSINISEISDETVNTQLKYSDWRMMIVNMIWPDDQPMFLERTDPKYLKENFIPGHTSSFDCLMMNLEGKYIWVKLIFSRSETNNDDDYRFVFMVQDIHENTVELMSTLKKYEEMASMDPLTNIFNHGRIETELMNAVDAKKKNGTTISTMMLDIDHFKLVNDNHGHSVGDMTLKRFSQIITDFFSGIDGVVGRWGGEEFVVVCYDTDLFEIKELAEHLRVKVASETFKAIDHITCSIGVTEILETDEANTVFVRMDKALYEAKSAGRNCVKSLPQ